MKTFLKLWKLDPGQATSRLLNNGIDISEERFIEIVNKSRHDLTSTDRFIMCNVIDMIKQDIQNITDFHYE